MAKLEIDLAPEEQMQMEQAARRAGLPVRDWVRQRLLNKPTPHRSEQRPVTFVTEDGESYEIPDLPEDAASATAIASEDALGRYWNSQEDTTAWNNT